jgi:hypothetical protein
VRPHTFLTGITVAALALAGCGDDDPSVATEPRPPTDDGYQHPTGADDVVLRIGNEGGFVPAEDAFVHAANLLVTGDGRLIQIGPVPDIYPGPLLPNLQQRSITEAEIRRLLALTDEHGLLADVTYGRLDNIADAADTVVTITVGGETFEHRAYALGLTGGPGGGEADEARARLHDFVVAATDLAIAQVSGDLGPEQPYRADTYLLRATEVVPDATSTNPAAPSRRAPTPPLPIRPAPSRQTMHP